MANVAQTPHLRRTGNLIAILGVAAILAATLTPAPGESMAEHFCLVCGPLGGVDSVLNILLFVPLGVGLALSGTNGRRAILFACALSVLVEMAQLVFIPGRDATIGDVVTNTVGAAAGFAVAYHAGAWLRPSRRTAAILALGWGAFWLLLQSVTSFALAPRITNAPFYGEIAPTLEYFVPFPGRVVSARIGNFPIGDSELDASKGIAQSIRAGARTVVSVQAGKPTSGVAPILRIADTALREILLVGQWKTDLVFGVRTGSAPLRLRAPLFAMRDVFPRQSTLSAVSDTLVLVARHLSTAVTMEAANAAGARARAIPITNTLGWILIWPEQWFVRGTWTEDLISALWTVLLLVPLGYWASCASRDRSTHTATRVGAISSLMTITLVVGYVWMPLMFGISVTRPFDWIAAVAAIVLGGVLGFATCPELPRDNRRALAASDVGGISASTPQ
jgi:VanZ family protein